MTVFFRILISQYFLECGSPALKILPNITLLQLPNEIFIFTSCTILKVSSLSLKQVKYSLSSKTN